MSSAPFPTHRTDTGQISGPVRPETRVPATGGPFIEVEAMRGDLMEGEQLYGTFGDGSGEIALLGITNRRLMFVDQELGEDRIGLTSVPFRQVVSCSYIAAGPIPVTEASTVAFKVGRTLYELGCGSPEEAQDVHGLIMWHLIGL